MRPSDFGLLSIVAPASPYCWRGTATRRPLAVTSGSIFDASLPRPGTVRALIKRDYFVARSYRLAFFLDLVFGVLNLVIFFFISRTFGGRTASELGGAPSYFAFVALGISVVVVMEATSIGLANRLREEQLSGTLEALVIQPVTAVELAVGLAGYPFLFAMIRA